MAPATQPRLLLLDEPMAGMGQEETARMVQILHELKGRVTILPIEHDMKAVRADRITVLVDGRIIETCGSCASCFRRLSNWSVYL
jgi:branched-chain amino acid transport system ATP-binding protein